MDLFEYRNNCRLCLKRHTNSMKNIFTHCLEGYSESIASIIFSLFKIELSSSKDYPQLICRKCLTEVESILLFKEDVQSNQEFLLSLFKKACSRNNQLIQNNSENVNIIPKVELIDDNLHDSSYQKKQQCISLEPPEYDRVPETFTSQINPIVLLNRIEDVGKLNTVFSKIKRESNLIETSSLEQRFLVYICKFCNKVFKCKAELNFHYKRRHNIQELSRNNKRISSNSETIVKKIKTSENSNNAVELLLSEADLKQDIKDEGDLQAIQPDLNSVKIEAGLPVLKNQASFLQNFNLIAKEEAATIRTKLATPTRKIALKIKKTLTTTAIKKRLHRPVKQKRLKKPLVNPLSARSKKISSSGESDKVLNRSVKFLERYGFRKLNNYSKRPRTVYNLGVHRKWLNTIVENQSAKTLNKKVVKKVVKPQFKNVSSLVVKLKPNKTVNNNNGCDIAQNSNVQNDKTKKSLKIKRLSRDSKDLEVKQDINKNKSSLSIDTLKTDEIINSKSKKCPKKVSASQIKLDTVSIQQHVNYLDTKPLETPILKCDNVSNNKNKTSKNCGVVISKPLNDADKIQIRSDSKSAHHENRKTNQKGIKSPNSIKKVVLRKAVSKEVKSKEPNSKTSCFKKKEHKKCEKVLKVTNKMTSEKKLQTCNNEGNIKVDIQNISSDQVNKNKKGIKVKLFKSPFEKSVSNCDIKEENTHWKCHNPEETVDKDSSSTSSLKNISSVLPIKSHIKLNGKNISDSKVLPDGDSKGIETNTRKGRLRKCLSSSSTSLSIDEKIDISNGNLGNENIDLSIKHNQSTSNKDKLPSKRKLPSSKINTLADFAESSSKVSLNKKDALSVWHALNDNYEVNENIGLRLKLRKTSSYESLSGLKYDTQDCDEESTNKYLPPSTISKTTSVPDIIHINNYNVANEQVNKQFNQSLIELSPEKIVNINLNDDEVQMLVEKSDCPYVTEKTSSLKETKTQISLREKNTYKKMIENFNRTEHLRQNGNSFYLKDKKPSCDRFSKGESKLSQSGLTSLARNCKKVAEVKSKTPSKLNSNKGSNRISRYNSPDVSVVNTNSHLEVKSEVIDLTTDDIDEDITITTRTNSEPNLGVLKSKKKLHRSNTNSSDLVSIRKSTRKSLPSKRTLS